MPTCRSNTFGSRVSSFPRSRVHAIRGGESGVGAMPDAPVNPPRRSGRCQQRSQRRRRPAARLHGPRNDNMHATTIGPDTIVVTLRDSLTKAERTLADRGQALEVLRCAVPSGHDARRLGRAVEALSGRTVEAFSATTCMIPTSPSRSSDGTRGQRRVSPGLTRGRRRRWHRRVRDPGAGDDGTI